MTQPPRSEVSSVSLPQFKKLDIRLAKILDAEDIPGADRIWKLTVDAGAGNKTLVAGIKKWYPQKEALIGKTVVVIDNLEPALIRGVESKGMLLAAKNGELLSLLSAEPALSPGSPVG